MEVSWVLLLQNLPLCIICYPNAQGLISYIKDHRCAYVVLTKLFGNFDQF